MDHERLCAQLPDVVREQWKADCHDISPVTGGMNSITASLSIGDKRYAAKWVPASDADGLHSGAETAERMAAGGIRSGPPRRTIDGRVITQMGGGVLAVLRWVDGEPLTGESADDQDSMGSVLARAHSTDGVGQRIGPFFASRITDCPELDVEPWVRPAVNDAVRQYRALPDTSWGTLHTDPAPGAFLRDGRTVGLIDWTGATRGPLLYDLASAVMYVGGVDRARRLIEAYLSHGHLRAAEVEEHLRTFQRLRWAVQAFYFAGRLVRHDLTGVTDQDENRKGLHDARNALG